MTAEPGLERRLPDPYFAALYTPAHSCLYWRIFFFNIFIGV